MNKSFISYFFVVALILSSCSESLNPSTLYIQCFINNGSTLVDVPSYALTVNP